MSAVAAGSDISSGIDETAERQPLGVFAAITPFNFPNMVPMWFLPLAITCGNTFIVKPSPQTPLSMDLLFDILDELDLPEGVVNLVHGGKESSIAVMEHPDIVGVSFVGSTPVAKIVYRPPRRKKKCIAGHSARTRAFRDVSAARRETRARRSSPFREAGAGPSQAGRR